MYLYIHELFFYYMLHRLVNTRGLTVILCHVILWFSQMITTRICVF